MPRHGLIEINQSSFRLDDYIATIIGVIRDDVDFRQILSADILYVGSGTGIPGYAANSNAHYEALENQGVDLQANLTADNAVSQLRCTRKRCSRRHDYTLCGKSFLHRWYKPSDVSIHNA